MKNNFISFNSLGKQGRLGNQMFQLAALLSIAESNSLEWMIPPKDQKERTDYIIQDTFILSSLNKNKNIGISNYPDYFPENYFHDNVFNEKYLTEVNEGFNITGYFQSYKYFEKYSGLIRENFKFKDHFKKICSQAIQNKNIDIESTIFLHIRRDDYLEFPDHHYNLPFSYFKKATKYFEKINNIIIFSDDYNWCKRKRYFKKKKYLFGEDFFINEELENSIDVYELCLMTMCHGGIISNSSFSWWGAWLQDKEKKIISPSLNKWFGEKVNYDAKDLILDDWIQLN